MADKKISALTGASTPLTGTEVLPIVQSGATVKVSVADLTASRSVSASALTLSGGTAKGVVYLSDPGKVATSGPSLTFTGTYLGIGTATPDSYLQVIGGAVAGLRIGISNTSANYYDADTQIFRKIDGTEIMRLTNQNLQISTAGKGVVLTSPDGLTSKQIRLSNLGVLELV
jgi:hypothetical protein